MLYARREPGSLERIPATRGADGYCGLCGEGLLAKCGEIVAHHWAHRARTECDTWGEETDWHLGWKRRFPDHWVEVTIGNHRADVKAPDGLVIEFQHSPLSPNEIRERERHYRNMLWLWDLTDLPPTRFAVNEKGPFVTFRWWWPKESVKAARRPVWIDLGERGVLDVRRFHHDSKAMWAGWGYLLLPKTAADALYGRALLSSSEWTGTFEDAEPGWRGLYNSDRTAPNPRERPDLPASVLHLPAQDELSVLRPAPPYRGQDSHTGSEGQLPRRTLTVVDGGAA